MKLVHMQKLKTVHDKIYYETNCFISWRYGRPKVYEVRASLCSGVRTFLHHRVFFQPCVGKRETIEERSVHLLRKCRHFYYLRTHFAGQIRIEGASGSKNAAYLHMCFERLLCCLVPIKKQHWTWSCFVPKTVSHFSLRSTNKNN